MVDSAADIVLIEARRAQDEQKQALNEARGRAALVFTVAGVTSSLLAAPALTSHTGLPALAAVAVGLWAAAAVAAVVVLLPWRFKFSNHPSLLLGPGWSTLEAQELCQQLGFVIGGQIDFNMTKLRRLWRCVQVAMLLTAASIAVWIVLLAKGK